MINKPDAPKNKSIKKCLDHLDVLEVDTKTKQIVYMYLEKIYREGYENGQRAASSVSGDS